MAQGNINKIVINNTGWQAEIYFESMSLTSGSATNSKLNTGFPQNQGLTTSGNAYKTNDTLYTSSVPIFTISTTRQAFDDNGNATTAVTNVYGTKVLRLPYPSQSYADQTISGSGVMVRCCLSDYIFAGDTNVTASIGAGLFISASVSSSATSSFVCVNSSTTTPPRVIGNWTMPGWERVTGSFKLQATSFHKSAQQGRPVRAVRFNIQDAHGHSASVITNTPIIDSTQPDAIPIIEYVATVNPSGFTALDMLTCSFQAYPWHGHTGSILDTNDGFYRLPTPFYANKYYLYDPNNNYGQTIAVVDPVNGNDGTGLSYDSASFSTSSYNAFTSIAIAMSSSRAYNNAHHSRNEPGNNIIYLQTGSHPWMGGAYTLQTAPSVYTTITRFPGTSRDNVVLNSQSSSTGGHQCKFKFDGVKIAINGTTINSDSASYFYVHNCEWSASSGTPQALGYVYVVQSRIKGVGTQGLQGSSNVNNPFAIIRGNNLCGLVGNADGHNFIGNAWTGSTTITKGINVEGKDGGVTYGQWVVAYNKILNTQILGGGMLTDASAKNLTGSAMVQNIIEGTNTPTNANAYAITEIGSSLVESTTGSYYNSIYWHNTVVGAKVNRLYNDTGSLPRIRFLCTDINNVEDNENIKTDTFDGGAGDGPDGGRIGNWSVLDGVANVGNIFAETAGIGAYGNFVREFIGLNSYQGNSSSLSLIGFVRRGTCDGVTNQTGSGNGDYHPTSSASPLVQNGNIPWILPYDLDGNPRTSTQNAIGAYTFTSSQAPVITTNTYLFGAMFFGA